MTERITLIEIDIDRCSRVYGNSPCTAALGVTGDNKCFNSLATCQDRPNYLNEIVTARYATASAQLPASVDAIPNIQSVSIRPAKLELGESIGIRAAGTIVFKDSRYPDTGPEGDRYLSDRDYDPYTRGTYWGKWRARFPFTKGVNIRHLSGTSEQALDQMEVRHFIVDKVAGPTSAGTFTLTFKDALQLVDGKQSQAPVLSNGALLSDITSTNSSFSIDAAFQNEYPNASTNATAGYISVGGKEIMYYNRIAEVFYVVRGKFGTEAVAHKEGDRVQLCLNYASDATDRKATYILADILENYANVPSSFIPLIDWTIEHDAYIDRSYSTLIAEPTAANKLINELLVQTASTLWWDDVNKLIRFRVLRGVDDFAATYNGDIIKSDSFGSADQPDKRVSRVWTYYGQLNPLEKLDDQKNYSAALQTVSAESETNFGGKPSIKQVFSRWIPVEGLNAVQRLNNSILSRYTTPPRLITFALQRDTFAVTPELGGGYFTESRTIQDATGLSVVTPIQVIQIRATETGYSVLGEEVLYTETVQPEDPSIKPVNYPISNNNINLRTTYNANYPAPQSGDTIQFTIETAAVIFDNTNNAPSIESGLWPDGVTVVITQNGLVGGRGGRGGDGGDIRPTSFTTIDVLDGLVGGNGETAIIFTLQTTTATFQIINNGTIGGGGGGGGGSGAGAIYNIEGSVLGDRLVGIGVTGAGGGGGRLRRSGGAAGFANFGDSQTPTLGNNGDPSTDFVVGTGGAAKGATKGNDNCESGVGGNGGQFGASGQSGTNGSATSGDGADIIKTSNGAAGGSPGNAIEKNGNSVTITNNGTILGAVI
jgi:hypothetical protein